MLLRTKNQKPKQTSLPYYCTTVFSHYSSTTISTIKHQSWTTLVNETDRTRSLWPGKKRSFFLVFRKLTYSPNMWRRFVVKLSKVKEPSTTDSFVFVSKCNVRQNFLSSEDRLCLSRSGIRLRWKGLEFESLFFLVFFATFPLVAHKKHTKNTQVLRLGGKMCFGVFLEIFVAR